MLELYAAQGMDLNSEQLEKLSRKEGIMGDLWELGLDANDVYEQVGCLRHVCRR